jgi:hypothetical protein
MDGINLRQGQGINPTKINIGEDGNLLPGAEKLDIQNKSWSVWDGNNWKPIMPQDMVAQAAAELREVLKNTDGKPVQSHNMDEGAQNAGGGAWDGNTSALPKPVESHQI